MQYPLRLRFKILALAPQCFVEDASGAEVCYVKQKLLRLKEKVEVFTDSSRRELLCTIAADRMIDFSASYTFRTPDGQVMGAVRRRGLKSLWRASYEILDAQGQPTFEIHEENPFAKVLDSVLGEIPVVGLLTGFFAHPRYAVRQEGRTLLRMTKRRAFFEGRFDVEQVEPVQPQDELGIVLSLLMFVLLERSRG
ncbi:hypothetical protein [Verrucomicrobium sp. BvORR106]|uniref:hypothetical protein n=1 Tax=Verrucomicrobium sp. BvORR106 TaxID=1403819 RepID=UPI000570AF9A|nr:hypothetical protein [Verrucomicrobium sp. BvORR106]